MMQLRDQRAELERQLEEDRKRLEEEQIKASFHQRDGPGPSPFGACLLYTSPSPRDS